MYLLAINRQPVAAQMQVGTLALQQQRPATPFQPLFHRRIGWRVVQAFVVTRALVTGGIVVR